MAKFKVHFENGHVEEVEAVDGTSAKTKAREKSGFFKDERASGGNVERVSKIVRVETVQQ